MAYLGLVEAAAEMRRLGVPKSPCMHAGRSLGKPPTVAREVGKELAEEVCTEIGTALHKAGDSAFWDVAVVVVFSLEGGI